MNKNLYKAIMQKAKLRNTFLWFKTEKKKRKLNITNKESFVKRFPKKNKIKYFNNFIQKKVCHNTTFGKVIKNANKENTLSNKSQVVAKSLKMNIWAFGTLNQLFKRGFLYSN